MLPVLAFQIYAVDAYRDFLELLHRADPSLGLTLPASAGALVASAHSVELSARLRNVFQRDPKIGERMLAELENVGGPQMTPKEKRAVASLVSLYRSGEVAYLNFYGPPRSIATVSYGTILSTDNRGDDDSKARVTHDFEGKVGICRLFRVFPARAGPDTRRLPDGYLAAKRSRHQRRGDRRDGIRQSIGRSASATDAVSLATVHCGRSGASSSAGACRRLRPIPAAVLVLVLASAYLLVAVQPIDAGGHLAAAADTALSAGTPGVVRRSRSQLP